MAGYGLGVYGEDPLGGEGGAGAGAGATPRDQGYGYGGYGTILPFGYDNRGCLVTPVYPAQDASGVPLDSTITVTVEDEDGVSPPSLLVEVDTGSGYEVAYRHADTSERFKSGWDGPASSMTFEEGRYTIVIDPTTSFGYSTLVNVRVTAADLMGQPERLP